MLTILHGDGRPSRDPFDAAVGQVKVASANRVRPLVLDPRLVVAPVEPAETVVRLLPDDLPLELLLAAPQEHRPGLAQAQETFKAAVRLKKEVDGYWTDFRGDETIVSGDLATMADGLEVRVVGQEKGRAHHGGRGVNTAQQPQPGSAARQGGPCDCRRIDQAQLIKHYI